MRAINGNEKVKKAIGLLLQSNITLHCSTPFLHIFFNIAAWPEISCFVEDVNKPRQNFLSLSEVGYGSKESNSRRVRLYLAKSVKSKNCDGDLKNADPLLKQRFHCYQHSLILKLLLFVQHGNWRSVYSSGRCTLPSLFRIITNPYFFLMTDILGVVINIDDVSQITTRATNRQVKQGAEI